MSQIQVDNIYNKEATGSPNFPLGANVTGVVTATSFSGSGANLTGIDATALKDSNGTVRVQANTTGAVITGNVSVGGTLTYEDVTNIDSVGVITARSGVKINVGGVNIAGGGINAVGVVTATNDIKANGNIIGDNSTNISGVSSVTATTYYGSGASLTGIDAAPQVKVNASGSISAGNAVVANADGTVSKIGLSYSAVDPIEIVGCPSEKNVYNNASDQTSDFRTCQLEDDYMVVVWRNESNSNRIDASWLKTSGSADTWSSNALSVDWPNGTILDLHHDPTRNQAVVVYKQDDDKVYFRTLRRNAGATSISAGTEHKLNDTTGYGDVKLSYDTAANKFLVVYGKDATQSNSCTAQVMTVVDNDTFTFGSLVTIKSNMCVHIAADFDTSAGKHLVLYRDNGISDDCYGIVATVSGTSVTFGTAVELETGNNEGAKIKYSTTDSKFLWLSLNESGGEVDVSVLTISGTSVSRGTNTTITTNTAGMNSGTMAISYEPNLDVFYILYRNNYVGKKRTATISGTNVTVGSEDNSRCGPNSVADCDIGFESSTGKTLLVMQNGGSNAGLYQVWTTSASTTNITAENYLGVSDGNYTNGQLATIKLSGNTDNNQSGLTPGQSYFARNDGTVSLTPQSPQVFLGNAVSSTKIALASPVAQASGWQVVSSHLLDGTIGYIDSYGWSNQYAQYKIVYDNIYSSSNWKPYMRIYKDATSGNTGTLKTANQYGSGSGYQRVQVTMNQLQRTGRYPSDFWKTGSNSASTYWSGENTFPMSTGNANKYSHWYGFSFRGHEHTYTSASGFYYANEDQYLTGIRFYFSTNDSGNTINPTEGRFTILRLAV